MGDKMQITASETGVIRVFSIDLPKEAIERFVTQAGTGEWPLKYAIGADHLRNDMIDVVDLRDLGEMSLTDYLMQGYDLSRSEAKEARGQLDALKGHVLVVPTVAFANRAQTLAIAHPLRWIGTYGESSGTPRQPRLRSNSARGSAGGPGSARSGGSSGARGNGLFIGLAAAVCLMVLAFALFA